MEAILHTGFISPSARDSVSKGMKPSRQGRSPEQAEVLHAIGLRNWSDGKVQPGVEAQEAAIAGALVLRIQE